MIETQRLKDTKEILENPLSYKIIGAAIEVHQTLGGPGLLEKVFNFGSKQVKDGIKRVING